MLMYCLPLFYIVSGAFLYVQTKKIEFSPEKFNCNFPDFHMIDVLKKILQKYSKIDMLVKYTYV